MIRVLCLTTEELQHGVCIDAIVEVAAVPTARGQGQAVAKGTAQDADVTLAENQVVGVVHHGDLVAALEVVLQCIQAALFDQLVEAATVIPGAPPGHQLFGDVTVEVAAQSHLEEGREAGALGDSVVARGDQAAAVEQVRGKDNVGGGEAERGADQHRHLLVRQPLGGPLEVIEDGVVDIQSTLVVEVAGQLGQYQIVEVGAVVDALHPGLNQLVEIADRRVEIDRRIEQQHALEVEGATGFVDLADEGGMQRAEAVTGQEVFADLQFRVLGPYRLHGAIQVVGIFRTVARGGETRGGGHEV